MKTERRERHERSLGAEIIGVLVSTDDGAFEGLCVNTSNQQRKHSLHSEFPLVNPGIFFGENHVKSPVGQTISRRHEF